MTRIGIHLRTAVALAAIAALAFVGSAVASPRQHVTGGTTTITASAATTSLLSAGNVTLTPIAPATLSSAAAGPTFTLPIAGGRPNPATLHGTLFGRGGLKLANPSGTVSLRGLSLISNRGGLTLLARTHLRRARRCVRPARHRARRRCVVVGISALVPIARADPVITSSGVISGTLDVTAFTAKLINRIAGKSIVTRGAAIGTIAVAPTLS